MAVQPEYDHPLRRYGLEQLLRIVGVRAFAARHGAPTVYYGHDREIGSRAVLWIPPGSVRHFPDDTSSGSAPSFANIEGLLIPYGGAPPAGLWNGNRLGFDIALATAFWLTLTEERHIEERDGHGRVPHSASAMHRHGGRERPPIHEYARLVGERLASVVPGDWRVPLWPDRKRYAVVLSHDVDAPERDSKMWLYLRECLLGNPRPRRQAYWALRAEVRAQGCRLPFPAPVRTRPEWDFAQICEVERRHDLRSAFFFSVQHRRTGHSCDVSYDASASRYRRLYRALASSGWEVGLQAAYQTCTGNPSVASQLGRLRELSGTPVVGLRHHYLQLDARAPLRTLAAHARAGILYETSVGYNDAPGFRAGLALPYQPFDPDLPGECDLVELPMTISDMHFPRQEPAVAVDSMVRHLQTVRSLGGLAVLNWHVGNWHSAPAWRAAYGTACELAAGDAEAWVARPREVASWWRRRSEVLRWRE